MIESVELNIYLNDDNNSVSLSLSPVQTEVIFKALGLQFHQNNTCSHFSDQTLKKHILPKINFKKNH
uniref:hypothetical protein n=1 Tax=Bacillus thuringiensis TaxID=1428 RepID=UPI0015696BD8|nr:hypothetical protein [Bacillus thuringiensis]